MFIFYLQIWLARSPLFFQCHLSLLLSCDVANYLVHRFRALIINSKSNKTNFFNFFTNTSDEVIIAASKFHRDLNLSPYFSTHFPCQIQGASYTSRVKVGDLKYKSSKLIRQIHSKFFRVFVFICFCKLPNTQNS